MLFIQQMKNKGGVKLKDKIISILIVLIIGVSLFIYSFPEKKYSYANELYQVYLNGEKIGLITDDNDLYNLINEKQLEIKNKYGVSKVYPPNGFNIVKTYSYDDKVNDVDQIYNQIEKVDDFTIKGYKITIHSDEIDEETNKAPDDIVINVLNKEIFDKALLNFVYSFVSPEDYQKYINNEQDEIKEVGKIIENMYFTEKITIREAYISVKEKIYTDETELSQYLLFGNDYKQETYIVKEGDTIAQISEENKLNPQEFLIANPKYKSEESLLTIGDEVSIALINPVISLAYEVYEVEDVVQYFEKKVVYDSKKYAGYQEVTQTGVNGINRLTETYKVVNGEENQGLEVISKVVIREPVDQITTKGKKVQAITGSFVDTGGDWAWPTNSGYKITSNYAWRWGKLHAALDISGTGKGSPIYAAGDGVVVTAERGTGSAWSLGNYVVIRHANNIYTQYAHMDRISVSVGQSVSKGKVVGTMGETGHATGVHLHFAAFNGIPYRGGQPFNPTKLYN